MAAGIIWGLPNSNEQSTLATCRAFQDLGLHYVKFTFLTYNPGTKVNRSMRAVDNYVTEDIADYDGNHLTFLPRDLTTEAIYRSVQLSFSYYYGWAQVLRRA